MNTSLPMRGVRRALGLAAATLFISACGTGSIFNRDIDYKSSAKLPPLEIPPDLTAPATSDRFNVPDVGAAGTATYSVYNRERATGPQAGSTALLPLEKNVRVERAGSERWLVVNGTPEQVWPVVKDFWQELGFIINVEVPEAGVMETDWAENRAKIGEDFIRRTIGRVFDNLYSTGERDKFRTRLERGPDGKTTEIYISHRGMIEVFEGGGSGLAGERTVWQPRQPDPGLEAEMLRRLMVRLGVEEARAETKVAAAGEEPKARLTQNKEGSGRLTVDDSFDRAWRRVGLALDRVGFTVEDRDRSQGVYFVRYAPLDTRPTEKKGFLSSLAFWRSSTPDVKPAQYRILLQEAGSRTQINVLDKAGKPEKSETGSRILNLLYDQLK